MTPLARQIEEYLGHLRLERNLAANTLAAYRRDLDRYLVFLGNANIASIAEISVDTVNAYQAFISAADSGLSRSSSVRMLAAVRGFHRFALAERWTDVDPCVQLVAIKKPVRLPKALSVAETIALVEALSGSESLVDMRDYALVEFLYSTGARISEACSITFEDLDLAAQSVRLLGKGGKTRVVPIGSTAVAAIDRYLVRARPSLATKASQMVFINRKGEMLGRQSAFNAVKRCAGLARLNVEVSPHTLRHCFATHLLEGGADVRIVQELLGHASVTTTQLYTLVTQQRLREVYSTSHPRARR